MNTASRICFIQYVAILFLSSSFSKKFIRVFEMQLCNSTDMATVLKTSRFYSEEMSLTTINIIFGFTLNGAVISSYKVAASCQSPFTCVILHLRESDTIC